VEQLCQLPSNNLVVHLYGLTPNHVHEVSAFARKISGDRVQLIATTNLEEAVSGAQLIINQVRIGGWAARSADEKVPVELGLVGDESLGLGGLRAALRIKSFIAQASRAILDFAPNAWILNLSNPSDLVTRLWTYYGCDKVLSLCSDAQQQMKRLATLAGAIEHASEFGFAGFSHIGWLTHLEDVDLNAIVGKRPLLKPWIDEWNAIPTLWRIHWSEPNALVLSQRRQPGQRSAELKSLVDELRERIRIGDVEMYRSLLTRREPVWYSEVVVPAIRGLLGGIASRLVVGLPNKGYLLESDPDVYVEGWAIVDRTGAHPEPPNDNAACWNDLRRLGEVRSLAFAAVISPNRRTVEAYAKRDAFMIDHDPRLDWTACLSL
jgi:6-phospho-beta-glucosidase